MAAVEENDPAADRGVFRQAVQLLDDGLRRRGFVQ